MIRSAIIFFLSLICLVPVNAKDAKSLNVYLKDSLKVFTARCQKVLDAAYMAERYISTNKHVSGWEGYPVKLYEYHTGKDINYGKGKKGLVYMLNPDARKLALWIIHAVYDVKGEVNYADLEKVRKFIMWQSGGQFPVKGVVYEAMYTPGLYEPYIFKDGVTVYIANDVHRAAASTCTEAQLQFYLQMENSDLRNYTGRYARICSTTREMYYAAQGSDEVGKSDSQETRILKWLDTVKKLYQKAWHSKRNFLIYAWAKSNL